MFLRLYIFTLHCLKKNLLLVQVVPFVIFALLIHPSTTHHLINRMSYFFVYLEAISVLPQLSVMQNTKVDSFCGIFFWVCFR